MQTNRIRLALGAITLSAAGLVGILNFEGYSPIAVPPVPGDVPTYGFGTTTHEDGSPLKTGEKITPSKAVERALQDVQKFEGALKRCVNVPLHQYEYDAFISLAYNIGSAAFCKSTLVKKLNAQDYSGACLEILKWDRFKGKKLHGLTIRRQKEYQLCMNGTAGK